MFYKWVTANKIKQIMPAKLRTFLYQKKVFNSDK